MATTKKRATKKKRAPAKKRKPAASKTTDEQRIVEANHILGVMRTHVDNAETVERLDELRSKADLMGFTQGEIDIACRWIENRRKEIEG